MNRRVEGDRTFRHRQPTLPAGFTGRRPHDNRRWCGNLSLIQLESSVSVQPGDFLHFLLSKKTIVSILSQRVDRSSQLSVAFESMVMRVNLEPADTEFLSHLQRIGPRTVQEICETAGVTATAVRQRLARLQGSGFVARERIRHGRGRPHYVYKVTELGSRQLGDNYGDLALILWRELHSIENPEIRAEVQRRVKEAMVRRLGVYGEGRLRERLKTLAASLASRGFDVEVNERSDLPVLREHNCPYLDLAEEDRGVCELERQVFEQALGTEVKLSQCCLDGHRYCEFEVSGHSV